MRRVLLLSAGIAVGVILAASGCDDDSADGGDATAASQSATGEPRGSSGRDRSGSGSSSGSRGSKQGAGGRAEPAVRGDAGEPRGGLKPGELRKGTRQQRDLLARAKEHFLADDLDAAEPIFERLVDGGPMSGARASGYIALGQIYLRTGRPAKAVDLLEGMPSPGERVVEARLVLARALRKQGRTREAIREFRRVIDLQPNYLFAYPALGNLYSQVGQKKRAAKIFLLYEKRVETLARALENPSSSRPVKRLNVIDIFSAIQDDRAAEGVRGALDDPNPRVRARAARASATMKIVSAEEQLQKLADDPAGPVRRAARSALSRLEEVERPPTRGSGFAPSTRQRAK